MTASLHARFDSGDMEDLSLEQAMQLEGDLRLQCGDGHSVVAHRLVLALASPVLRDMLLDLPLPTSDGASSSSRGDGCGARDSGVNKRRRVGCSGVERSHAEEPHCMQGGRTRDPAMFSLKVSDEHMSWVAVVRELYRGVLQAHVGSIRPDEAFRILPVAHKYAMRQLLGRCLASVQDSDIPVQPAPLGSPQQPGLLQWLVLADRLRCDELVSACLLKLRRRRARSALGAALSCPDQAALLLELRAPTLVEVLRTVVGFTMEGAVVCSLSNFHQPTFRSADLPGSEFGSGRACLMPGCVLYPSLGSAVKIWGLDSHASLGQLTGHHRQPVSAVVGSRDGHTAFTASQDGSVGVWGMETQRCRATLRGAGSNGGGELWALCECRLGRVAAGAESGAVHVWDVEAGRRVGPQLVGHGDAVLAVEGAHDGAALLTGSADRTLRLWDVRTGRCVRVMAGHSGTVQAVAVDAAGHAAASGSVDSTLRVWDLASGRCMDVQELGSSGFGIPSLAMDEAGTTVVSLCEGCPDRVQVWSLCGGGSSGGSGGRDRGGDGGSGGPLLECVSTYCLAEGTEAVSLCAGADLSALALLSRDERHGSGVIEVWQ